MLQLLLRDYCCSCCRPATAAPVCCLRLWLLKFKSPGSASHRLWHAVGVGMVMTGWVGRLGHKEATSRTSTSPAALPLPTGVYLTLKQLPAHNAHVISNKSALQHGGSQSYIL